MTENLTALAESVEAEFMFQYEASAPEPVRTALGITARRIGGGVSLAMRADPSGGYWCKSLGIGLTEPVTAPLIGEIVDFHREHGSPMATLQIAPEALPADWDEIRAAYGIAEGGCWVKLAAPVEDVTPGRTDLRVGPVGPADAREWATLICDTFGMSDEWLSRMVAATVEHPHFRPFAAWDGDEIVAGANLYLHGEVASLNSGATRPDHRGRGAQSALLAARARAAAEAGCRWLVGETGRPAEGASNSSLNNMLRFGLRPRYDRRNWIWRPESDPTTA
ncbi:GNAT family N-acetyltransferase [Micromonospora sp. NPDC049559]|uniref:GNAT family N-acetyltransferase n=1 Tax=Micromonospora sp. NPDC049559 TaxID=3155923 RepID=UPI00344978A7